MIFKRRSLLQTMEGWVNPFQSQAQVLICLSTGKLATEVVPRDLLPAQYLSEKAYQPFSKDRLESNLRKVKFKTRKRKDHWRKHFFALLEKLYSATTFKNSRHQLLWGFLHYLSQPACGLKTTATRLQHVRQVNSIMKSLEMEGNDVNWPAKKSGDVAWTDWIQTTPWP